ncbi:MAG: LysR family transcriptional regulator [Pseudomonadota bacterium]
MLNTRDLETFLWSARLGSFSAAAEKLSTTQPAVSMRIQQLERGLGFPLFVRTRSRPGLRLTVQGREFVGYAEQIVGLAADAQTRLGDPRILTGHIRLGVTETIALTWLPDLLTRFSEKFPRVVVDLNVDLTAGVWKRLQAGDLEIALLPGPVSGPRLTSVSLGAIRYAWMASPRLGIPRRRMTPAELAAWPVVTLSRDSVLYDRVEDWFRKNGAEPRRMQVCNSLGVVTVLTIQGLGVSLLPPSIFRREVKRGELVELNTAPKLAPISFNAVYRRAEDSPLIGYLANLAREVNTFEALDDAAAAVS